MQIILDLQQHESIRNVSIKLLIYTHRLRKSQPEGFLAFIFFFAEIGLYSFFLLSTYMKLFKK